MFPESEVKCVSNLIIGSGTRMESDEPLSDCLSSTIAAADVALSAGVLSFRPRNDSLDSSTL